MDRQTEKPRRNSWRTFSLRSLLVVMALVAAYFGGRSSRTYQHWFAPPLAGKWQASLPAGARQPTTLSRLDNGRFLLSSRASVFNGEYRWQNGRLVVVKPADQRMDGLEWKWDGQKLLLVAEPPDTPTGPSYLGTTLTRGSAPMALSNTGGQRVSTPPVASVRTQPWSPRTAPVQTSNSNSPNNDKPPLVGNWRATLPAGARQPVTFSQQKDGSILLVSRASVFNGEYRWRSGRLVVVKPSDERMKGLQWKWDGQKLLLVAEPPDTPTGPSYLGTTLTKRKP